MKKILGIIHVLIILLVLGIWWMRSESDQSYQISEEISLEVPEGYTKDDTHTYQLNSQTVINGTKYTIPASLTERTNLSSDTYISIEKIPTTSICSADLFLDGVHPAMTETEGNTTYSFTSSMGAGAGNRYEEFVYALPETNPCVAIRYFIHSGAIQNYPEGTTKEFNRDALIQQFDEIRRTLILNQ